MHSVRKSSSSFPKLLSLAGLASLAFAAGCGSNYRPVVSSINPVGPAGQPVRYAVAISNPGLNLPALATVVDFSGDTVLATPSILANPSYFVLGSGGTQAYVVNQTGELDTFPVVNPSALLTSSVSHTNLGVNLAPVSLSVFTGASSASIYVPEAAASTVAAVSANGPSLVQNIAVPANPTYVVGTSGAARSYALSAGNGTAPGTATAIENSTSLPTISAALTVGVNPVYGVFSADLTRAYILNKGSNSVSVINVLTNAFDSSVPTINTGAAGANATNPLWAELVPTLTELLVLNAGNGTTPGSLSIVSIPACNSVTTVTTTPTNCLAPSYTDAVGYGTVLATVPVGVNPSMVSALSDGSRAYVINSLDPAHCSAGEGSVSVVNLRSNTVSSTICGISTAAGTADVNTSPTLLYGHPNSVITSNASPTGKVYITSGDNKFLTVLRTDTDTVQTHITLQGTGLRVLVTAQ